jgi:regulator of sigma E protease
LAGLRPGDEIKAIDGHDIHSTADAADALYQHPPSEELQVIVVPSGGARELDLLPRAGEASRPKAMLGVILENHSGAVVISELYVGGPAEIAGLRSEDRIVAIAGHPMNVRAQVVDILKQFRPADQVDLLVSRREWERHVPVTLVSPQQIAPLPRGSIPATATDSTPPRYQVPGGYRNLHWADGESVLNIYDVNRRALYTAFD